MAKVTFDFTVQGSDDDDKNDVVSVITAKYDYYPACKGLRERSGLQIEPDEPAYVDIVSVAVDGLTEAQALKMLGQETMNRIYEAAIEEAMRRQESDWCP